MESNFNNSMINNITPVDAPSRLYDSTQKDISNSNFSMTYSKSKTKSKSKKALKLKIECKKDPKIIFESNSEELTIHIISCDDCLKQLLLYQARQEKNSNELLNNKRKTKKSTKNKKSIDINNSMQQDVEKVNKIIEDDDSDEDEGKNDSNSESEEEAQGLEQTMTNINASSGKVKKIKKRRIKKRKK